ncbi:hypothetical protein GOODEAATRI_033587, partial [Goodea atripinnis]
WSSNHRDKQVVGLTVPVLVRLFTAIWIHREDFLFKSQLTCQKASPLLTGPKLTGGVPTGNTRRSASMSELKKGTEAWRLWTLYPHLFSADS